MKLCDLTLPTPEENLACDEALLDLCEAGGSDELLRLWAPPQYFVVLGYANKAATEVNLPFCRQPRHPRAAPLHRRRDRPAGAGRAQLLADPAHRRLRPVPQHPRHQPVHSRAPPRRPGRARCAPRSNGGAKPTSPLADSSSPATPSAAAGASCSSTAPSCCTWISACVEQALPLPSRQPDYRVNRSHADFLINLNVPPPRSTPPSAKPGTPPPPCPNPLRPDHPPGPREILAGRVEPQVLAPLLLLGFGAMSACCQG